MVIHPQVGSLNQDEATRLAYALAAKAAQLTGVRALAIKGIVASHHGLRAERTAADIDVLIEPDGFAAFTRQLEEWGWRPRVEEFRGFRVPHHSVTYLHDGWPCDIDAHHRFPGFLAPPLQVFDALWERRQLFTVAGRLVPMTDWAGSVAILGLHSVRSIRHSPLHKDELQHLADLASSWTSRQRTDLAAVARATGCTQSLDLVWRRLGIPIDPAAEDVPAEDLAEWRRETEGRVPGTRFLLRSLRGDGPRQSAIRARVLLWPPESYLRGSCPFPDGRLAILRARVARHARVLRMALQCPDNALRDALDAKRPDPGAQ